MDEEKKMQQIVGLGVSEGIAIGKIEYYKKEKVRVDLETVKDIEMEIKRFQDAKAAAEKRLDELIERAERETGKTGALLFEAHKILLEDSLFNDSVINIIQTEFVNTEYAISVTGERLADVFAMANDDYMKARAADIKDLTERLISLLQKPVDREERMKKFEEPVILLAEDLMPTDTIKLDKEKILAIVTTQGTAHSHSSILARLMGIPAVVKTYLDDPRQYDGVMAIVNGRTGQVILNPDEKIIEDTKAQCDAEREEKRALQELIGQADTTKSGKNIKICANIGGRKDLQEAVDNDASGIGLLRSEIMFIERRYFPSENEQYEFYKAAAEAMKGKDVIIRTLDLGTDKKCDYMELDEEENPALGCRGIRLCFRKTEMFKKQLRALFRAAVHGNVAIMYPMITGAYELQKIEQLEREVMDELEADKLEYRYPKRGVMIETPAAVMMSAELAKMVDFFSIGTNDLIQYCYALDRQDPSLEEFVDPDYKAVFRMIQIVTDNAHAAGIPVGICGEMAADDRFLADYISIGVDELSVTPGHVLQLRRNVREMD